MLKVFCYLYLVSIAIDRRETAPAGINDLDFRALKGVAIHPRRSNLSWVSPCPHCSPKKPSYSSAHIRRIWIFWRLPTVIENVCFLWGARWKHHSHHIESISDDHLHHIESITYIICSECCQTAKSNPSKKRWHRPVQRSRSSSRTGKNSTPTFSWQSPWCPLWRPVLRRHIQPHHAFSYHPLQSFWNAPNTFDLK